MNASGEATREVVERLKSLYSKMLQKRESEEDVSRNEADIRSLFRKNVLFIRNYTGFCERSSPYTRDEWSEILEVSNATVKGWEQGRVLANSYSLKRICDHANQALRTGSSITPAILFCKNLVELLPSLISGIPMEALTTITDVEKEALRDKLIHHHVDLIQSLVGRVSDTEELYQAIVELSPIGIFVTNEKLEFVFANEAMCGMVKVRREDIIGKHLNILVHPNDRLTIIHRVADTTDNRVHTHEIKLSGPSNSVVNVQLVGAFIEDQDGHRKFLGSLTNITDMRNIEELLIAERRLFKMISDDSPSGILYGNSNYIEYMNPEASRILGLMDTSRILNPIEFVNRLIPNETYRNHILEELYKWSSGNTDTFNIVLQITVGGKDKTVQVKAREIHGKYLFIINDTQSSSNPKAQQYDLPASVLTASDIAYVVVSLDGKILRTNTAVSNITGIKQQHLIGSSYYTTVLGENETKSALNRRKKYLANPKPLRVDTVWKDAQNNKIPMSGILSAVLDHKGIPHSLVFVGYRLSD